MGCNVTLYDAEFCVRRSTRDGEQRSGWKRGERRGEKAEADIKASSTRVRVAVETDACVRKPATGESHRTTPSTLDPVCPLRRGICATATSVPALPQTIADDAERSIPTSDLRPAPRADRPRPRRTRTPALRPCAFERRFAWWIDLRWWSAAAASASAARRGARRWW